MKLFDKLFGKKNTTLVNENVVTNTKSIIEANKEVNNEINNDINNETNNEVVNEKPKEPLWKSLPDDFAVTDKESARVFFMACEGKNGIMKKNFPQDVYDSFENVTDYQNYHEFTREYALKQFDSILNNEADYIPTVMDDVFSVAGYWGMDFYDEEFITYLTAVSKLSNERSPRDIEQGGRGLPIQFQHDVWIGKYLSRYNNRNKNIFKVKTLVEMTYSYLTEKYTGYVEHRIGEVIETCINLKGIMNEMSEPDASLNMKFSLLTDADTEKIVDKISTICEGDIGSIKEEIYSLNCVYGVSAPPFFITAASEAVDYGSNNSWDIFRFVVVFHDEDEAIFFSCSRRNDGYLVPEKRNMEKYPILEKYLDKIISAIAFYRNCDFSDDFLKSLEADDSKYSFYNENDNKQKQLCKRFGECFKYMRERINNQSIAKSLNELLDCLEEAAPNLGINQTKFNSPATSEEINECEERNGITIPLKMKEFLMFSNGASLFENSTTVWNTEEIGKYNLDGYDDENAKIYIPIGDFIGDGTMFVLNKETGAIAEYDHETGEVMEYGDFEDFLAGIMDFHS